MNSRLVALAFGWAAAGLAGPIVNPGFETATVIGTAEGWVEEKNFFGANLRCTIAVCGSGSGTAGPRTGGAWIWFGGLDTVAEVESLWQSGVTIPIGTLSIGFSLWKGASNTPATLSFKIDGVELFKMTNATPGYGTYTPVTLPVAQFADGLDHTLRFDFTDVAGANTNISLDDITLSSTAVPEPGTLALAALALAGAAGWRQRRG